MLSEIERSFRQDFRKQSALVVHKDCCLIPNTVDHPDLSFDAIDTFCRRNLRCSEAIL
jgi:hypothetical protein